MKCSDAQVNCGHECQRISFLKTSSHNTPPMFLIYILVLPVCREPLILGESQEEDLPTKQSTKQVLGQLWDCSSFSCFLWLLLCSPALDWNVCDCVSDWRSFTSRHVSSATPMSRNIWESGKEAATEALTGSQRGSPVWPDRYIALLILAADVDQLQIYLYQHMFYDMHQ